MKSAIAEITGLTISEVILAEGCEKGITRVFLVFDNETYIELWGASWNCGGGIDKGGADVAVSYATKMGATRISRFLPNAKNEKGDK
jgi:hypothetical protein